MGYLHIRVSLFGLYVCLMSEVRPYEIFLLPLIALRPRAHKNRKWTAVNVSRLIYKIEK